MKRLLTPTLLILLLLPAVWLAGASVPLPTIAPTVPRTEGSPQIGANRFIPVDVYIDAGTRHLAAYQVEVMVNDSKIVGLEGGESSAFSDAPFYDPLALQSGRIIVAAFSTAETVPTGLTRVARLHVMVNVGMDGNPATTSKLMVATDQNGQAIEAKCLLSINEGVLR